MHIALIQQHATEDRQANRQRGLVAARQAAASGANLICFAELAFDPFWPQYPASHRREIESVAELAEPIPGKTTEMFCDLARELGVVIVLNLFERCAGETFDSSPVIDADGSLLGVTRMVHITEYACFHEQGYYAQPPGSDGPRVYDTAVGRVAVAICYDRHYPEYMRACAVNGAELVIVPQAGAVGEWPDGLYEAEMRIAAFHNGYFTALCNRVGREDALMFAGESFVCDPAGNVIARAAMGTDEILLCEVNLAEVPQSHARQLFMRDRRPGLYAEWLGR